MEKEFETMTYVPTACQLDGKFEGNVTLRKVDMLSRFEKLPQMEALLNDGRRVEAAIHAIKATQEFWTGVAITRKRDGKKYGSLKDLMLDSACDGIISEVSIGILQGFPEEESGN